MATWRSPSVPFLKPMGMDSPEASWRWIWLSVVRAPMAPQEIEVRHVLRADGFQEFGGGGQPQGGDLLQELAGGPEPGGHVVAAVQAGIVDEALPAHGGARLFEVGPHHDQQVFLVLLGLAHQPAGVFQAGLGIVDGAGAHDDQEAVVHAVHDGADFVASTFDDVSHPGVQRQLGDELLGSGQRRELADAKVGRGFAAAAGE